MTACVTWHGKAVVLLHFL